MSQLFKDYRRLRFGAMVTVSRIHSSHNLNFPRGLPKASTSLDMSIASTGEILSIKKQRLYCYT